MISPAGGGKGIIFKAMRFSVRMAAPKSKVVSVATPGAGGNPKVSCFVVDPGDIGLRGFTVATATNRNKAVATRDLARNGMSMARNRDTAFAVAPGSKCRVTSMGISKGSMKGGASCAFDSISGTRGVRTAFTFTGCATRGPFGFPRAGNMADALRTRRTARLVGDGSSSSSPG